MRLRSSGEERPQAAGDHPQDTTEETSLESYATEEASLGNAATDEAPLGTDVASGCSVDPNRLLAMMQQQQDALLAMMQEQPGVVHLLGVVT